MIDTSTLIRTVAELKQQGVNTKFAILDAGYYSDENIQSLYDNNISFITRLKANRRIYKELIAQYLPSIEQKENLVSYNTRYAYIQCVPCNLIEGQSANAKSMIVL
ncbi:MAG: transposase [Bacteroidales bacterium]|nr:transposase [Bacteroidales bacterium]